MLRHERNDNIMCARDENCDCPFSAARASDQAFNPSFKTLFARCLWNSTCMLSATNGMTPTIRRMHVTDGFCFVHRRQSQWQALQREYFSTAQQILLQHIQAEPGATTAKAPQQQLLLMPAAERSQRRNDTMQQLQAGDAHAESCCLIPSVAAAQEADAATIAAMERRRIASGLLSPFAAVLRAHRDKHRLLLLYKSSFWAASSPTAQEALAGWERKQDESPMYCLSHEVRLGRQCLAYINLAIRKVYCSKNQ